MILLIIIAIVIVATIVLRKRQKEEKIIECEEKLQERLKIIKIDSEQLPAYKEKFLKDCIEGKEA